MSTAHEDASLTDSLTNLPDPEVLSPTTPVLITGGFSGTGLVITDSLLNLGVHVISGTRSQAKFNELYPAHGETEGEPRITPFIADLTNPEQVGEALQLTAATVSNAHLVLSAAGGMESFSRKVMLGIVRIGKLDSAETQITALNAFGAEILEQALAVEGEGAYAINCAANIALVEEILKQRDPSHVRHLIFLSSFPSTFYNDGFPVPAFYEGVARSKNLFEKWLKENSERLVEGGLVPVVVSGNMLIDTGVALIFRALNRLKIDTEALDPANFPVKQDLATAVIRVLQGQEEFDVLPGGLFVHAQNVITREPPSPATIEALNSIPLLRQQPKE